MTSPNAELARIEESWAELSGTVARLGPEGLGRTGADGWSVLDHLAHIAAWERSALAILEGKDRLAAMGVPGAGSDLDTINRAVWARHHDRPAAEVLVDCREAHDAIVAALSNLSDADLQLPYSHYQPGSDLGVDGSRPVVEWIRGDTHEHYAEHTAYVNQLIKESSASR